MIANSEGLQKRALDFENRYAVDIIENGVDNQFFAPDIGKRQTDKITILFVSRLLARKGLQNLIPELPGIQAEVRRKSGREIQLVIVGDGPYRPVLEEMAAENKVQGFVHFEGGKNRDQVRQYYQAADLFVLPSLAEGMPNVVLEAMASGLPIVMTPCEEAKSW